MQPIRRPADIGIDATLQRSGGRIRVSVELLRVADTRLLWAQTFDQSTEDLFRLQDAFAGRVAAALPLASAHGAQTRDTSSVAAYEAAWQRKQLKELHAANIVA